MNKVALVFSAISLSISAHAGDLDEAIFGALGEQEIQCGEAGLNRRSCEIKSTGPLVCVKQAQGGFAAGPSYFNCLLSNFVPESRDQKDICYDRIWSSFKGIESKNGTKAVTSKSGSFSITKKSDDSYELRVVINGNVVSDKVGKGCDAAKLCENMQLAVTGDDTFTNPENPDNIPVKMTPEQEEGLKGRLAEAVRKSPRVCPPQRAMGWNEQGEGKTPPRSNQPK